MNISWILRTYLIHRFRGQGWCWSDRLWLCLHKITQIVQLYPMECACPRQFHVSRVCFGWDSYPPPMPVVTCGTARAFKSLQGKSAESLYCESTQWKRTHECMPGKDWKLLVLTLTNRRCASSSSYALVTSYSVKNSWSLRAQNLSSFLSVN